MNYLGKRIIWQSLLGDIIEGIIVDSISANEYADDATLLRLYGLGCLKHKVARRASTDRVAVISCDNNRLVLPLSKKVHWRIIGE